VKNPFRSKQQADVETLRVKIAEAEKSLAVAEADLAEKALSAALTSDPHPAAGQLQKVREATDRLEVLRRALAAAERLEADRKREATQAVRASQNRAIAQHVGRAIRAAQKYQAAVENEASAFDELMEIAATVDKLVPSGDETMRLAGLNYRQIKALCFDERCRVGSSNPNDPQSRAGLPGTEYRLGFHALTEDPLPAKIEKKLKGALAILIGRTEKLPEPPQAAEPESDPIHPSILALDPFLTRAEPTGEAA
jgi:hypothetical protein